VGRVQDQGRVDHTAVHVAVSPLTGAPTPVITGHSCARALLLDVVARIQLAVVACWARICNEAGHSSVVYGRSWRSGISSWNSRNDYLVTSAIVLGGVPVGNIKGVCVTEIGTFVEFHCGSHVDIVLPGLLRYFLSTCHGERGSKLKFRRTRSGTAGSRVCVGHAGCYRHSTSTKTCTGLDRGAVPCACIAAHSDTTVIQHSGAQFVAVGTTAACHSLTVAAQGTLVHRLLVARDEVALGQNCWGQAKCQFERGSHWEKLFEEK